MNLYEAIKDRKSYLKESKIKIFAYQLLKAMEHMHKNGIFHRDIKPENILIKENYLVLADLGSCKGIYSKPPFTEYVSTRWYRAPECIMTNGYYNYKMDLWGVGCVLFEISTLFPLFPGDNEIDQMQKIQNILGTPNQDVINSYKKHSFDHENDVNFISNKKGSGFAKYMTHCSNELIDLISGLLNYNVDERFSAKQALQHNFFKDINENLNLIKMPMMGINNSQLIKNFINDSLSFIKSTEDSQGNINVPKKKSKEKNIMSYLPEVNKKNSNNNINGNNGYIYNEQHSQGSFHSSNNEEDANNSNNKDHSPIHKIKLPKLGKIRFNNQDKGNNANNNSLDNGNNNNNNNNNQNNNNLKVVSMMKKMNILKQKYISPYSQKAIFNIPQRHNN